MELFFSLIKAFIIGGLFCVIGQLLLNMTSLPLAKILVGFVICGVILGAIGVYGELVEFAGAGASVPITGFGFLLQKGIFDDVRQYGLMGIFTGALKASSAGVSFAILMGFLVALIFKPKKK